MLFNYTQSQTIPGGASAARATLLDTNMTVASQLPLKHQMIIFSIAAIFDEAKTASDKKGLVHVQTRGGYLMNTVAEGVRKWRTIKDNVFFRLIIEQSKPYSEGRLCEYPAGGGLYFFKAEEAYGTVRDSAYNVNNGEPGMHAARRLSTPIHLASMESFQGSLLFPRGSFEDYSDGAAGTPTAWGVTIELRGARQRPVG